MTEHRPAREQPVRVRFAPSPTGDLHVGNVRTALYDWAYARRTGGTFVLRIEDTDSARVSPEAIQGTLDAMRWMGLQWDEGPDIGGPYEPYRQSERIDLYRGWVARFLDSGHAYYCYESAEEAAARVARQKAEGRPPGYEGHSRDLDETDRARYEAEGRTPVVRFRMPAGSTAFTDVIRGGVVFDHAHVPDFVLTRADGSPLYTLAAAVDDVEMNITHIVRGEDLLSSTPRQIAVYRAMGVAEEDLPTFAHLPFVMGPDNQKLSKRHGAVTVSQFRADGYLPEALGNYLALLGWSLGDGDREEFTLTELAGSFTLERVNRNPARFDRKKLDAINGDWIRRLDAEEVTRRLTPFLTRAGLIDDPPTAGQRDVLAVGVPLVHERITRLDEAVPMLSFALVDEADFVVDPADAGTTLTGEARAVIDAAIEALEATDTWASASIEKALRAALVDRLGRKPKHAFGPVRVAVTGRRVSPPLFESIEMLGRDRTLARLGRARARCDR